MANPPEKPVQEIPMAKEKKTDKEVKVKKERKNSIAKALYALFDDRGVDKTSFEKAQKVAQSVKEDSAFNEQHFSWYKNQYRVLRGLKSPGRGKKGKGKESTEK